MSAIFNILNGHYSIFETQSQLFFINSGLFWAEIDPESMKLPCEWWLYKSECSKNVLPLPRRGKMMISRWFMASSRASVLSTDTLVLKFFYNLTKNYNLQYESPSIILSIKTDIESGFRYSHKLQPFVRAWG